MLGRNLPGELNLEIPKHYIKRVLLIHTCSKILKGTQQQSQKTVLYFSANRAKHSLITAVHFSKQNYWKQIS